MPDAAKALSDYKEGDVFRGDKITQLFSAQPTYLIYEGNDCGEVTVASSDSTIKARLSKLSPKMATVTELLVNDSLKKKYIDQIALAYREIAEGNDEKAFEVVDNIIDSVVTYKRNLRNGRFYYLLSCLAMLTLVIAFSYFLKHYDFLKEITPYFYYMTYAAIGGFLSVSRNIKKIEIDASEFGWRQTIYGAIRILIAMLSGLIIFVVIESDLILPQLDSTNFYLVSLLAIVADFSESLIPNLLDRVEKENVSEGE